MAKDGNKKMSKTPRSIQETVDSLRVVGEQFSSALKVSTFGDEINSFFKELNHSREMMRTIFGPLEDLRRIGLPALALNDDIQSIAQSAQTIADGFRLLKTEELEGLIKPLLSSSVSSAMKQTMDEQDSIKNAMKAMRTPWINTEDINRSFQGFSKLQSIGGIIQKLPTFDDEIADISERILAIGAHRLLGPVRYLKILLPDLHFMSTRDLTRP